MASLYSVTASASSGPVSGEARAGLKPIHPVSSGAATTSGTLVLKTSGTKGVVSPHPKVYLVFWGSQWLTSDPAGARNALTGFFTALHGTADTYDTILAQYCEGLPAGTTTCGTAGTHIVVPTSLLGGAWVDSAAAEPSKATQAQIAAEAVLAAAHFGNTTQKPNLNAQYVIVSASGTHPDGFPNTGFCGWHSFTHATAGGNIAYTNLPYVPDLGSGPCTTLSPATPLDGMFSTETHEYSETVTDFWPARGWVGPHGNEIGDECVQLDSTIVLSTGTFDVQGEWSNSASTCVTHG